MRERRKQTRKGIANTPSVRGIHAQRGRGSGASYSVYVAGKHNDRPKTRCSAVRWNNATSGSLGVRQLGVINCDGGPATAAQVLGELNQVDPPLESVGGKLVSRDRGSSSSSDSHRGAVRPLYRRARWHGRPPGRLIARRSLRYLYNGLIQLPCPPTLPSPPCAFPSVWWSIRRPSAVVPGELRPGMDYAT